MAGFSLSPGETLLLAAMWHQRGFAFLLLCHVGRNSLLLSVCKIFTITQRRQTLFQMLIPKVRFTAEVLPIHSPQVRTDRSVLICRGWREISALADMWLCWSVFTVLPAWRVDTEVFLFSKFTFITLKRLFFRTTETQDYQWYKNLIIMI